MATTKPRPATDEEHVADKLERYNLSLVPNEYPGNRDVVKMAPFGAADDSQNVVIILHWDRDGNYEGHAYHGPPWKRNHERHYANAARVWLAEKRDAKRSSLVGAPDPEPPTVDGSEAEAEAPPPLPPAGPPCAGCGAPTTFEHGYVGGRGYCWRPRCTKMESFQCEHIERWRI